MSVSEELEETQRAVRHSFFSHPSKAVFIAASQSGKSHTIRLFLDHQEELYGFRFSKVHLFTTCTSHEYLAWASEYNNLVIEERTPTEFLDAELNEEQLEKSEPRLVILEDYLVSTSNIDKRILEFFTSAANHRLDFTSSTIMNVLFRHE